MLGLVLVLALASPGEPLVVSLSVNGVPRPDTFAYMSEGGADFRFPLATLEAAGLRHPGGERERIGDAEYVPLSTLAPGVRFRFDADELRVELTAEPALLPTVAVDLGRKAARARISHDASLALTYSVSANSREELSGALEATLNLGGPVLAGGVSARSGGAPLRGLTSLTIDDRARLVRWTAGDALAGSPEPLAGSLVVGGLGLARSFELDPGAARRSPTALAGVAVLPSTADVYVDGRLVRRLELPPGTWRLEDLPVQTGSATTRVVLRDALGRVEELGGATYVPARVLAPGVSEFGYHLGLRRDALGGSWDYGGPAFLGWHRLGLLPWLTGGLRLEATAGLVNGGASLSAGLPFGELGLSFAASNGGVAGALRFTRQGRETRLAAELRAASDGYASLSPGERPRLEASASLGVPAGRRLNLTLSSQASARRDGGTRALLALGAGLQLGRRATVAVTASESFEDGPGLFATLNLFLGARTSASLGGGLRGGSLHLQGPGYRLDARAGDGGQAFLAAVEHAGRAGRLEAQADYLAGEATASVRATGGVALVGGGLQLAPPLPGSYALIDVPGQPGVRAYLDGREVGRTGADGSLLVSPLRPYEANRLAIEPLDLPLGFSAARFEDVVAPPARGGAVVRFPVRRRRDVTGRLDASLRGGELRAGGAASPIGNDGAFYLEGLAPGRWDASVVFGGASCRVVLEVPPSEAPLVDVGAVRCLGGP